MLVTSLCFNSHMWIYIEMVYGGLLNIYRSMAPLIQNRMKLMMPCYDKYVYFNSHTNYLKKLIINVKYSRENIIGY